MEHATSEDRNLPRMPIAIGLAVVLYVSAGLATVYALTQLGVTHDILRTACALLVSAAVAYPAIAAAQRATQHQPSSFMRWMGIWVVLIAALWFVLWLWQGWERLA